MNSNTLQLVVFVRESFSHCFLQSTSFVESPNDTLLSSPLLPEWQCKNEEDLFPLAWLVSLQRVLRLRCLSPNGPGRRKTVLLKKNCFGPYPELRFLARDVDTAGFVHHFSPQV